MRFHRSIAILALLAGPIAGHAQESDSPMVRLLKSGKVPDDRLTTIVDMIGKRGAIGDLSYLYFRAVDPKAFSPPVRRKALDALAEAALTRGLSPDVDLTPAEAMLAKGGDPDLQRRVMRLCGLWKSVAAIDEIEALAREPKTDPTTRAAALDALAVMGTERARHAIERLCAPEQPKAVRIAAVSALAQLDPAAAAPLAAGIIQHAGPELDLTTLIQPFTRRKDGPDQLAAALGAVTISSDAAKLALRALYAIGRSDPPLVALLSRVAGLDQEVQPLDPEQLKAFVAEVAAQGDPQRGEALFRRADLNCGRCHAIQGVGGGIGPDLGPIGQSSPVDYIINSLLLPDQAIKEEFHTLIVLTVEGQVFQGIVVDRDQDRVRLKEATGEIRTIPTSAIEDSKEGGSLMPKGLVNLMTRSERLDLVRFLSELGKPGPYAIRTVPAIRSWRILDAPPLDPPTTPDAFRAQVLDAAPDRWRPENAFVSGALPLDDPNAKTHAPVIYAQGDIHVTDAGPVQLALDSSEGLTAWFDDQSIPLTAKHEAALELTTGKHRITLRIDTTARKSKTLLAELKKPPGSTAEFTLEGGK